jgi:hypothetical protein
MSYINTNHQCGLIYGPITANTKKPGYRDYEWEKKESALNPNHSWQWSGPRPTMPRAKKHDYFAFAFISGNHWKGVIIHKILHVCMAMDGNLYDPRPHWNKEHLYNRQVLRLSQPLFKIPHEIWIAMGGPQRINSTTTLIVNKTPLFKNFVQNDFILLHQIRQHENYVLDPMAFEDDLNITLKREQTIADWHRELF